ncbi:hypothetical protein NUSPORA_01209 [Nucleospora cyclopteri]
MLRETKAVIDKKAKDTMICTEELNVLEVKLIWHRLIDKYGFNTDKLKTWVIKLNLLAKGIPQGLKYIVWSKLLEIKLGTNYSLLRDMKSKHDHQISVDVQRTGTDIYQKDGEFKQEQIELYNILIAFSNYNVKIGYCQGMSDIGAFVLTVFNEQEAFEVFCKLIENNRSQLEYVNGKLNSNIGDIAGLFDEKLSLLPTLNLIQGDLFNILNINKIISQVNDTDHLEYVLLKWYLTFFSRFQPELTYRIWDFLVFYDFNVLFYFTAAIIKYFEEDLKKIIDEQELFEFVSNIEKNEIEANTIVNIVIEYLRITKNKYL